MELTPRTAEGPENGGDAEGRAPSRRRPASVRRRVLSGAAIVVVLGALGVVVFKGLSDATVYFLNADEAVEQRDSLEDRRFRLQGTVTEGVAETGDGASFDVRYNCVDVGVRHVGDPPQMFRPGIPVVLEGRWDSSGDYFASDTMFVAHDAEYEASEEYDERVEAVEADANADCPVAGDDEVAEAGSP